MAKDWIMVRIERKTWARLDWIRKSMISWYQRTGDGPPGCEDGTLALNTVLQVLTDRFLDHRDRSRKSKARRKARRAAERAGGEADGTNQP